MIERLDIKDYENKEQLVWFGVINKINALVDAVNSLRDDCNLLMGYIAPENKCEPAENPTISKMENVGPDAGTSIVLGANCRKCGIGDSDIKLWQELIRTRKALEQSEICCTEWEKQALDYKAENIALSGDLERTRKAMDKANAELEYIKEQVEKSNAFIDARIKVAAEQIARGIIAQVKNIKSKKE